MASITIKINMDNAAFEDDPQGEVIRILGQVIGKINHGLCVADAEGKLRDTNGNTCGSVEIEED